MSYPSPPVICSWYLPFYATGVNVPVNNPGSSGPNPSSNYPYTLITQGTATETAVVTSVCQKITNQENGGIFNGVYQAPKPVDVWCFQNLRTFTAFNAMVNGLITLFPYVYAPQLTIGTFAPTSITVPNGCAIFSKHPFVSSGVWDAKMTGQYQRDYSSPILAATYVKIQTGSPAVPCTIVNADFLGGQIVTNADYVPTPHVYINQPRYFNSFWQFSGWNTPQYTAGSYADQMTALSAWITNTAIGIWSSYNAYICIAAQDNAVTITSTSPKIYDPTPNYTSMIDRFPGFVNANPQLGYSGPSIGTRIGGLPITPPNIYTPSSPLTPWNDCYILCNNKPGYNNFGAAQPGMTLNANCILPSASSNNRLPLRIN